MTYDPNKPFAAHFAAPASQPEPEKPPPPLCVWCNAPWTDDMLKAYAYADYSGGDYGTVESVEITIDVTCSTCKRLVYRKHIEQDGNWYGH